MDHLVMISCHIHSKIMARNELAAVPIRPASMDYEYGFLTRADVRLSLEEQALLRRSKGRCSGSSRREGQIGARIRYY